MKPIRHCIAGIIARLRRPTVSAVSMTREESLLPVSSQEAHLRLHRLLHQGAPLQELSHFDFMSGWVAMAYIAPALNPDEAGSADGGWPTGWAVVAAEAFRRHKMKSLTHKELYPRADSF